MTTREPDGSIILRWGDREEVVKPQDLEGWRPVEDIQGVPLPEVTAEIPPTLVVDLETTGLNPTRDRVLAVGLALYRGRLEEVCEVLQGPDERDLLSRAFQRIRELAPKGGVLVGYNHTGFDLPLLYLRAQKLGLSCPFEPLRGPRGEAVTRRVAATAGIISRDPIEFMPFRNDLGLQIVDALHLVARYEFTTRSLGPHKSLKNIAVHFGVAEPDRAVIPPESIPQAAPEDLERYLRADLREAYRVYELLIKPFLVVSRLTSLPLEDVVTRSTAWVWQRLLERCYKRTEVPDEKQDYPGGLVVSRPGLYYPCAKLDVASLYPTIMLTYRIHSRKDTEAYALSWLRSLTEKRLELKERAKKGDEEAKVVQEGLKVLLNSLYGFYATGGYGFNDMVAAQRITELGRKVLVKMIAAVEDLGGLVVAADTDGLIVRTQDPERVLDAVQQALPQPFRVDIEWSDAVVLVSDRKNYIVMDRRGNVIAAKGSKWRGRDREALWVRFPCEFLRRLVFLGPVAAIEYVREVREKIASGRGWEWVMRTHRVSAADKYLREAGLSEGEVAEYAYRDRRKRTISRSPAEGYDVTHYTNLLLRVFAEIAEVCGLEVPEDLCPTRRTKREARVSVAPGAANGLGGGDAKVKLEDAVEFLKSTLESGPRAARDVLEAARSRGISKRTLARGRDALGVESFREGGRWWWRLSDVVKERVESDDHLVAQGAAVEGPGKDLKDEVPEEELVGEQPLLEGVSSEEPQPEASQLGSGAPDDANPVTIVGRVARLAPDPHQHRGDWCLGRCPTCGGWTLAWNFREARAVAICRCLKEPGLVWVDRLPAEPMTPR
jgi:DNA polymerase elongation subunit (family B)